MKIIYNPGHQSHYPLLNLSNTYTEAFSEKPERIQEILKKLSLLTDKIQEFQPKEFLPEYLEVLQQVHDPRLIQFFLEAKQCLKNQNYLYPEFFLKQNLKVPYENLGLMGKFAYHCTDTASPLSPATLETIFQNVFMVISGIKDYLNHPEPLYLLTRPPGHHAGKSSFGGYCYFNNVAIAAQLTSAFGKTGIIDIDYHHGNGTQEIFYDRSDVAFASIHADPKLEYPYISGFIEETGAGQGRGYNLNLPLPLYANEVDYLQAFQQAIDFLDSKNTQFLILSVSFDFLECDPLGGFLISPEIFKPMANMLKKYPVPILIQEGGYNIPKIGEYSEKIYQAFCV